MVKRKYWQDWEVEIVQEYYQTDIEKCRELLSHRTTAQIYDKANRMGLVERKDRTWQQWEIDLVENFYREDLNLLFEKLPHRTEKSIKVMITKIRPDNRITEKWTKKELDILKKWYSIDVPKCLKLLPNRTSSAIYTRAGMLGLTTPKKDSWSEEEDEILIKHNPNFDKIKSILTYRSRDAIRRRAYDLQLPNDYIWTDEENQILIDNYRNMTYKNLAEKLENRTESSIQARIQWLGLSYTKDVRTHHYDEDLFSFPYLRNGDEATLLGMIYADGNVSKRGLRISTHERDEEYLRKIIEITGYTGDLYKKLPNSQLLFLISSVDLVDQLKFFGVFRNKSLQLRYPSQEVLNGFEADFIRGYFEGDGHIGYKKDDNNARINILGTKAVVTGISNFLYTCGINRVKIVKKENIHSISYGGRQNVAKIGKILYDDVYMGNRKLFMKRKYNKFVMLWEDLGLI